VLLVAILASAFGLGKSSEFEVSPDDNADALSDPDCLLVQEAFQLAIYEYNETMIFLVRHTGSPARCYESYKVLAIRRKSASNCPENELIAPEVASNFKSENPKCECV